MPKKILIIAIIIYIFLFSYFCFWKYHNFGYNGLDLAIYNQVFYNSVNGRLFQFTIHPQLYLGDHFEIFIIFLLPFYYLYQSPLTLLFLQTVFLASCAWPIFLITKNLINVASKRLNEKIALLTALLWLFNPFVQNINLFEFHLLPFALFFILFAFYFYQQRKFWLFLTFLIIALLAREDVALLMVMFGFLALGEKRSLKWILSPLIISGMWFIIALKLIAFFAPAGQYKFFYYYSWLGNNFLEIIKNLIDNPLLLIKHLLTWQNIFFVLGLLIPFGYLVIFQLKYLLLGLPIFVQILLTGGSNTVIVLQIHYISLLLVPLFIALIYEMKKIMSSNKLNKIEKFLNKEQLAFYGILSAITIYSFFTLGPVLGLSQKNFYDHEIKNKRLFLKEIDNNDSLATSFEFLTNLSSRQSLYSLHYAYIGKEQFSLKDYSLPTDVDKILADTTDFLSYQLLFPNIKIWDGYNELGDDNLRKYIKDNGFQVTKLRDTIILWEKSALSGNEGGNEGEKNFSSPIFLYELNPAIEQIKVVKNLHFGNGLLKLYGWTRETEPTDSLNISFFFQALNKIKENYNLRLMITDQNNLTIYQKDYPLAYGLYPTTEWQDFDLIKINYRFVLPKDIDLSNNKISFQLFSQKGVLTLNKIKQIVPAVKEKNILGQFFITP